MSELQNRIVAAGLNIGDPLHTLNVLQALPSSYEIVQQTILATIDDFSEIKWSNICSRILSEELHQTSTPGVNVIHKKGTGTAKTKCTYCGGKGHLEKDCHRKACGLSKEEARTERCKVL